MTSTIDAGPDYAPIDLVETGDFTIEETAGYTRAMDGAAPQGFKSFYATLFEPIRAWWETPAESARMAQEHVAEIAAGQDRLWGETKTSKQADVLSNPAVQQYLITRMLGRGMAAANNREYWMHRIMNRRLEVVAYALNQTRAYIKAQVVELAVNIQTEVGRERTNRKTDVANVVKLAFALRDKVVRDLQDWTRTEIAWPIVQEIANVHKITQAETAHSIAVDHGKIIAELAPAIAAIAFTQTAMQRQLNGLQTESDTCVQPMCETQGPNSPLGRLFNSLKAVKWLAILAALETTDIKTLEKLANTVAGTEGEIGAWVGTKILEELQGGA